jgi:hypothetical protein
MPRRAWRRWRPKRRSGANLPLMISMTLTDLSGRNLSGHTVEAFWYAVRHAKPLTIGLNCSFGAAQLRPHVKVLSDIADTLMMVYPNAGLPNELGEYDEMPDTTAGLVANGPSMARSIFWAVAAVRPRRISRRWRRRSLGCLRGRFRRCRCGRGWPGWSHSRWRHNAQTSVRVERSRDTFRAQRRVDVSRLRSKRTEL